MHFSLGGTYQLRVGSSCNHFKREFAPFLAFCSNSFYLLTVRSLHEEDLLFHSVDLANETDGLAHEAGQVVLAAVGVRFPMHLLYIFSS